MVREFYSSLPGPVRVGIEATGSMPWFLELMEELGIDCQVGHPAKIRAAEPRETKARPKRCRAGVAVAGRKCFPSIWMPSSEQRDVRRDPLSASVGTHPNTSAECLASHRTESRVCGVAHRSGARRGQQAITSLALTPYAPERRTALQSLYRHLEEQIEDLDRKVKELALAAIPGAATDDPSGSGTDYGPGDGGLPG